MKTKIYRLPIFWLIPITTVILLTGCKKQETLPVLSKIEVSEITQTTAKVSRLIIADGGSKIEASGIVWGKTQQPMLEDNVGISSEVISGGKITSTITGLTPGTQYFMRAYAVNKQGTAYSEPAAFITTGIINGSGVVDNEGNHYPTVVLGDQEWMSANLKTAFYNDGTPITKVSNAAEWINLSTGAMCWYENDKESWGSAYGALYNWFVIQSSEICPQGWHIPSKEDWTKLSVYIGGDSYASERLRSTRTAPANHPRWDIQSENTSDAFGFAAQPGGARLADPWNNVQFISVGTEGYWWSSSENNHQNTGAWFVQIGNIHPDWAIKWVEKTNGFSIRCVKDLKGQ